MAVYTLRLSGAFAYGPATIRHLLKATLEKVLVGQAPSGSFACPPCERNEVRAETAHDQNALVPCAVRVSLPPPWNHTQSRAPGPLPLRNGETVVETGGNGYLPNGLVNVPLASSLMSLTSPLT